MSYSKFRLVVIAALMTVVAGCGDRSDSASSLGSDAGILRYIPADTPYVIAAPGRMPDDVSDKLEPHIDELLGAYHRMLRAMANNAEAETDDVAAMREFLPLIDELGSLMSSDGLRGAGINRDSQFAIYGIGLLPVMRITLSDGALFESAFARLEEAAGTEMQVATVDGNEYRYAGDDDGRVIVAIIDNELVLSLVPTGLSDAQLGDVLGLTIPAENIATAGVLTGIAADYDYIDYGVGLIDITKIVDILIGETSGLSAEVLSAMDYQVPDLSDVCRAEIRDIAAIMPRVVSGYKEVSTERLVSHAAFELRGDLAEGLATIVAPVPGLGQPTDGLFSFGMSMNLLAARNFYEARLDALEADPFRCELLAEGQNNIQAGREILNQPVPPIVYGFKGFFADIDGFEGMDLANDIPPTSIDMRVLIATENAESLLAMGTMFSPDIASLNITPGGDPVRLDLPMLAATGQAMYVAMSDEAIALSMGEGMQDGLTSMLAAPALEPSPFIGADMDAARYYGFIQEAIEADPDSALDQMPEMQEALRSVMGAIQKMFKRSRFIIGFTGAGIEMESEAILAD